MRWPLSEVSLYGYIGFRCNPKNNSHKKKIKNKVKQSRNFGNNQPRKVIAHDVKRCIKTLRIIQHGLLIKQWAGFFMLCTSFCIVHVHTYLWLSCHVQDKVPTPAISIDLFTTNYSIWLLKWLKWLKWINSPISRQKVSKVM